MPTPFLLLYVATGAPTYCGDVIRTCTLNITYIVAGQSQWLLKATAQGEQIEGYVVMEGFI